MKKVQEPAPLYKVGERVRVSFYPDAPFTVVRAFSQGVMAKAGEQCVCAANRELTPWLLCGDLVT